MSNLVPANWTQKALSSVCNIVGGGTPERSNSEYWNGDVPWVSPSEVTKLRGRYICNTNEKITRLGLEKSSAKLHPVGTVLMTSRASIGYAAITIVPMTTNQGFQSLQCTEQIFNEYLYQLINWLKPELERLSAGSTFSEISSSTLKKLKILVPPLPEQRKIAAILTSVDSVIEQTQAQIDKLKMLKTGMMQELLSPTPENYRTGDGTVAFKDSPLGPIPEGWEVALLDQVSKRGSGHTPSKQYPEYWNGGIKWISLADSYRLDQLYISDTDKQISELGIANSSAVMHPAGTVLMSRDAGIGKSAVMTEPMAVSQHFIVWVCGEKLNNYFLYYLLQYWKPKFEAIAMGSTIKTIGLPFFKSLEIPVPCLEEQQQIARALRSVDERLFGLIEKLERHQLTKKALMQDLLTGKVRVNTDA